ncbi:MAG TPA: hypothetical protein VMT73_13985 [Anaerolineales bacterium]|nr:hypothetical protein [Anaerolineales bacterium]
MSRFLTVLLLTVLLTACAPRAPQPQGTPPEPTQSAPTPISSGNWTVELNQSGGIMGLQRNVTITSDGKVVMVDKHTNQIVNSQLSPKDLSQFKSLLDSLVFDNSGSRSSGCADCFYYDLEIQTGTQHFLIQLDDVSLADSDFKPLVVYLRGLMDQAFQLK